MSTTDPNAPIFPPFDFKMEADPDDPMCLRAVLDAKQTAADLARWAREVEAGRYTAELVRLGWTPPGAARPAPVWDEDTVTEAVARAMFPHYFTDNRQPLRVFTETRSDAELWEAERESARRKARQALAVVRERLPVSGESRATVQAEALREAAEEIDRLDFGPDQDRPFSTGAKHKWGAMQAAKRLRARADRLEQKEK